MGRSKKSSKKGGLSKSSTKNKESESSLFRNASLKIQEQKKKVEDLKTTVEKNTDYQFSVGFLQIKLKSICNRLNAVPPNNIQNILYYAAVFKNIFLLIDSHIDEDSRVAARKLVFTRLLSGICSEYRHLYVTILSNILKTFEPVKKFATLEFLDTLMSDVMTLRKDSQSNVNKGYSFYIGCLIQGDLIKTFKVFEKYLDYLRNMKGDLSLTIIVFSVLNLYLKVVNIEKKKKSKIVEKYTSFLPKDQEKYLFKDIELAASMDKYLGTELLDEKFVLSENFTKSLFEHQKSLNIVYTNPLWNTLLEKIKNCKDEDITKRILNKFSSTFFPENSNEGTPLLTSIGFSVLTKMIHEVELLPSQFEHLITHSFVWHLSYCLNRDYKLGELKKKLSKKIVHARHEMLNAEITSKNQYVLKNTELCDEFMRVLFKRASKDSEFAKVFSETIRNHKQARSYAGIYKLSNCLIQYYSSEEFIKESILNAMKHGNSNRVLATLIPSNISQLKKYKTKEDVISILKALFANSFFTVQKEQDIAKQNLIVHHNLSPKIIQELQHKFFSLLNLLCKAEIQYFENKRNNFLQSNWCEQILSIYSKEIKSNPYLVPLNEFSSETENTQEKLLGVIKKLDKSEEKESSLHSISIKLLLYRVLIYQFKEPKYLDEMTVVDLMEYVAASFGDKKQKEENVDSIEVLTDVMMYLLSKSDFFFEIITFILLNQKLKITNDALDVISQSVLMCLGLDEEEDEEEEDEEEEDEEEEDEEDLEDEVDGDFEGEEPSNSEEQNIEDEDIPDEEEDEEEDDDDEQNEENKKLDEKELEQLMEMSTGTLGDDEMFQRDKFLVDLLRKSQLKKEINTDAVKFGKRVIELLHTLFLYNPKQESIVDKNYIQIDTSYKIMIYLKFIGFTLKLRNKDVMKMREKVTLFQMIESITSKIQTTKNEHRFVMETLNDDLKEQLLDTFDTLSRTVRAKEFNPSTDIILVKAFCFIGRILYTKPGKELHDEMKSIFIKIFSGADFKTDFFRYIMKELTLLSCDIEPELRKILKEKSSSIQVSLIDNVYTNILPKFSPSNEQLNSLLKDLKAVLSDINKASKVDSNEMSKFVIHTNISFVKTIRLVVNIFKKKNLTIDESLGVETFIFICEVSEMVNEAGKQISTKKESALKNINTFKKRTAAFVLEDLSALLNHQHPTSELVKKMPTIESAAPSLAPILEPSKAKKLKREKGKFKK